MRIWDIPVAYLCQRHLLAEHAELHAIWSIITNNKRGYANHPEVIRWRDAMPALKLRHDNQVGELSIRGMNHRSDVRGIIAGTRVPSYQLESVERQIVLLRTKPCSCFQEKEQEVNSGLLHSGSAE